MDSEATSPKTPKVIEKYILYETLGRGSWGKVKKSKDLISNLDYACKIIHKSTLNRKLKNGLALLKQEYELVKGLNHKNIIKYHDLIENDDKVYLFMELCGPTIDNGNVQRNEELLKKHFKQLLEGLSYLHLNNISHHDIKTTNVLIGPDNEIRICDFGIAESFENDSCHSFYGTPAYQPPEIAGNVSGATFSGSKADVWSAGIILYFIKIGKYPFEAETVYLLYKKIEEETVKFPKSLDSHLFDLLQRMLEKDPEKRSMANELLNHEWFSHGNKEGNEGNVLERLGEFLFKNCF